MKKLLVLFFALLLPILIFLFLKTFGKNEFEVPVLFSDAVSVPENCSSFQYKAPYSVPDSLLSLLSWNNKDELTIFVFEDGAKENKHERDIHIARIFTEFKNESFRVVTIFKEQITPDIKQDGLANISFSQENFKTFHDCVFLLASNQDAVIIDSKKRIRGQYNLVKREDADRMIMQEMNILFKRY